MTEHAVGLIWDAWRTRKNGAGAIAQRQRARLIDMVVHARANSPYCGELYRDLPDRVESADQLPVTDKKMLMGRFDEWCADRAVTLKGAEALVGDPSRIGEWFLGKYTVMTTSGRTGRRGLTFRTLGGDVRLPPLALTQSIEAVRGVTLFQLAQSEPERLELRLQIAPAADADTVWREAEAGLRKVLAEHGLEHVVVERGGEPPEQGRGGKFREVIPLSGART